MAEGFDSQTSPQQLDLLVGFQDIGGEFLRGVRDDNEEASHKRFAQPREVSPEAGEPVFRAGAAAIPSHDRVRDDAFGPGDANRGFVIAAFDRAAGGKHAPSLFGKVESALMRSGGPDVVSRHELAQGLSRSERVGNGILELHGRRISAGLVSAACGTRRVLPPGPDRGCDRPAVRGYAPLCARSLRRPGPRRSCRTGGRPACPRRES